MKIKHYLIAAFLLLQSVFSIQAQTVEGTEFWATFGKHRAVPHSQVHQLYMQIRVVGGSQTTTGVIKFTNLDTSIDFEIDPYGIYDYGLDNTEMAAVYNTEMGITDYSVRITTSAPVTVFSFIHRANWPEVTNVLPVTALGTEYYQISYTVYYTSMPDAYAVVATQNNTLLYHNGIEVAALDAGEVYYRPSTTDMTGVHITSNKPVALFAMAEGSVIPAEWPSIAPASPLMQQVAPVNTLSNTFFVPVTVCEKEIVRIVVSQDGTNIEQTGGVIRTDVPDAQTTLTGLQAGQFVELDITLANKGCYIQANKPVGVCSYITEYHYNGNGLYNSYPSQCWIPGIEQTTPNALMAPFIPNVVTYIKKHYALIFTPTATKDNTMVSIAGAAPTPLSGGNWYDNDAAKMSFYSMLLTETTASYVFLNQKGLIVLGYGVADDFAPSSYYYLAYSAMRDLQASFYANDIHYQDLEEQPFCENLVEFRAETENIGVEVVSLEWYIDGTEYLPAHNQETWSKTFAIGEYEIEMRVYFENDETLSKTGTLKIVSCGTAAEFYANDVHHSTLKDTIFCAKNVDFHAEIEELSPDPGSLRWFIDGVEETAAQDMLDWNKEFETGVYEIKMEVVYEDNATETITGTLKVEVFWIKMKNITH